MIEAIVGFNGSGKGLFTMEQSFNLLAETDICIVGNFAFNLPELGRVLAKRFPEKEIYVDERVRILDSVEIKQFYKYLPLGYQVDWPSSERFAQGEFPDFSKCRRTDFSVDLDQDKYVDVVDINQLPRCVYIIDEAWEHFAFDGMSNRSKSLIWLLNQHRKFDLDVWFCSPAVTDLDPKIRNLVRKTHVMRNMGEEKLWKFRKPSFFVRSTYNGLPSPSKTPEESPAFKMDLELANCYYTAKGVGGLVGRTGADSKRKKKGINMIWLFVAFVVLLVAMYFSGDIVTGTFFHAIKGDSNPKKTTAFKVVPPIVQLAVTNSPPAVEKIVQSAPLVETNVFLVGYQTIDGFLTVFLSDGSKYSGSSGRIGGLYSDGCLIDGHLYRWKH
jgi:hypothetical protein